MRRIRSAWPLVKGMCGSARKCRAACQYPLAGFQPPSAGVHLVPGPILVDRWEVVMEGWVCLKPEVRGLLRHLGERRHDLVRANGTRLPPMTGRLVWTFQAQGSLDVGTEDPKTKPLSSTAYG